WSVRISAISFSKFSDWQLSLFPYYFFSSPGRSGAQSTPASINVELSVQSSFSLRSLDFWHSFRKSVLPHLSTPQATAGCLVIGSKGRWHLYSISSARQLF